MALVKNKTIISNFLLIALIFSVFSVLYTDSMYAATKADENLVNSVSSPDNGVIQFKITCPAKSTVSYTLGLKNKKSYIDKKTGSFKNTGKKAITKTIKYSAKYFSNKYKITAKATVGNARNKNYRTDTDSATSKLVKNIKSDKVTWNAAEIKKYNNWQTVSKLMVLGSGVTIDIFTDKVGVGTALSIYLAFKENTEDYSTKNIQWRPIAGYSWQVSYKKTASGYTTNLLVYNKKNKLDDTFKLKTYTYKTITPAVH